MNSCYPASINIRGTEYTVRYVDRLSGVDPTNGLHSLSGHIDLSKKVIHICDGGRPAMEVWDSIFHEIIHGIAREFGIEPLNSNPDEDLIERLAFSLVDVMNRNGWVMS